MPFNFKDQVVIVTGGGRGIGREACIQFAKYGAIVVCVDLDEHLGNETINKIKENNGEAVFIKVDVTNESDVQNYINTTVKQFGKIDVLVNNAGFEGAVEHVTNYPTDVFNKVMAINVTGVFLGMKYVLKIMKEQKSGTIINMGSTASWKGAPGFVAYIASKHAVIGMTRTAALEVARLGIRVNAVCPGAVDTDMMQSIAVKSLSEEQIDQFRKNHSESIPDGRYGKVEEVANQILYLASDLSSHITGQSIIIDGGALAN